VPEQSHCPAEHGQGPGRGERGLGRCADRGAAARALAFDHRGAGYDPTGVGHGDALGSSPVTTEAPTIRTERFVLRGFRAADVDEYLTIHADAEVMRLVAEGRALEPPQAWAQLAFHIGQWRLRGYGSWAIEDVETGRLAGRVGFLHPPDLELPELGVVLARAWQGRGCGREVLGAVLEWAFHERGLARVTSWVRPGHDASAAMVASLGGRLTGTQQRSGATFDVWTFTAG
jgi:RimJ/RimL family protein N-acetyltransferase